MTPYSREAARLPETYIFHRLVTSGEIAVYDQIVEACAARTGSSFAWPTNDNDLFAERARRQFWVTPSSKALLRLRGEPTRLETGAPHAEMVSRLHEFMSKPGRVLLAGYGAHDQPFFRECAYRSLLSSPVAHPNVMRIDVQLVAAAASLLEPETISFPVVDDDDVASLAGVCKANGFDVEDYELSEARPFVAATMALAGRLQERAPDAFAALLACADPNYVRSIADGGPFLHISIRGGRTHVRPLLAIAPAAPDENLRCVDLTAFLGQPDDEIRRGKSPRGLKIVAIKPDHHEIVAPLTGPTSSDKLRQLIRRPPGERLAFLTPSADQLLACARKLRGFGRLVGVLNEVFSDRTLFENDVSAPSDELSSDGPSRHSGDAFILRMLPAAPRAKRGDLIGEIRDPRLREFGRRIIWESLGSNGIAREELADFAVFKRQRLLGRANGRWRTIAAARLELAEQARKSPALDTSRAAAISRYLDFLEHTASA